MRSPDRPKLRFGRRVSLDVRATKIVPLQDNIDQFCGYFAGQVETIRCLSLSPPEESDWAQHQLRFYRKVLLINGVDTLSGIRFPRSRYPQLNRRNQDGFIRFLEEGQCWELGPYVNLPFLTERIQNAMISQGRLRELIDSRMATLDPQAGGSINYRDIDKPLDELRGLASTEQEERAITECQHFQLLYRYRNHLVHESREPGTSMEIGQDTEDPYYHGYVGEDRFYVAYPLQLFVHILEEATDRLRRYLERHQVNPYGFVEETSRW